MRNATSSTPLPTDLHEDQVVALLRSGAHSSLLRAYFGELEYRELSQFAKLAATRKKPRAPIVFVLPGMLGSRLALKEGRANHVLWLHPSAVAHGRMLDLALPTTRALHPLGVMLPGYLKMKLMLEIGGFRPIFFPFDWRADVERSARAFVRAIDKIGARKVSVVAHSMGGLVARAALIHDKKRRIGKLIQLGSPNAGSFAPVQALRAVYPTVRKIAALDRLHSAEELARKVFLTLPGLYQLLPFKRSEGEHDFCDARNWPEDLPINPKLLTRTLKVRANLPNADERCHAIAGVNCDTITSVVLSSRGFEYSICRDGDGTVPTSRAHWPGAKNWFTEENHGTLSTSSNVLSAVIDVLRNNESQRLASQPPAANEQIVRRTSDEELRRLAVTKVDWESLSLDSRRRILEPVFTPEFLAPIS